MNKVCSLALAGLATCAFGATALAATPIRGTVQSVSGKTLAIKTYDGGTSNLMLTAKTKYAWVVPSSLSQIKKGDFIGAAATGPTDDLRATEVVIFPNSMRGTGEGHYPWTMPAQVARADMHGTAGAAGTPPVSGSNGIASAGASQAGAGAGAAGAPPVQGTMTNATVASVGSSAANGAPPVQGTMTNGTVAANGSGAAGGKTLTVTYGHGQQVHLMVPAGAPVVRFQPAQKSILAAGQKTIVFAGTPTGATYPPAEFVAVGKNGLMPPM